MDEIKKLILLRNQLRQELDNFDHVQSFYDSNAKLNKIKMLYPSDFNTMLDNSMRNFDGMIESNANAISYLEETIEAVEHQINELIYSRVDDFSFARDQLFHEDLSTYQPIDFGDNHEQVRQLIALKSHLRYPVLCLAPRDQRIINWLVGGDPLYLCMPRIFDGLVSIKDSARPDAKDKESSNARLYKLSTTNTKWYAYRSTANHGDWFSKWQLHNLINHLPEQYQRRVRLYSENNLDFSELPQGQFGNIIVWDYFNYLTLEETTNYLKELLKLLRPGGEVTFSYNNAETSIGLQKSISKDECYNSETILKRVLLNLKYDFVSNRDIKIGLKDQVSIMTIKRPGTLSSIKVSQSLAGIVHKSKRTVEVIRDYSQEEIEQMWTRAHELGIENINVLRNNIYEPHILEKKIKEKEKSLSNGVAKPK